MAKHKPHDTTAADAPTAKGKGKWAHLGDGHWVTIHYDDGDYRHVFIRGGGNGQRGTVVAGAALREGSKHGGKTVARVEHHAAGAPNPGAARQARYARIGATSPAGRNETAAIRNLAATQKRNRRAEARVKPAGTTKTPEHAQSERYNRLHESEFRHSTAKGAAQLSGLGRGEKAGDASFAGKLKARRDAAAKALRDSRSKERKAVVPTPRGPDATGQRRLFETRPSRPGITPHPGQVTTRTLRGREFSSRQARVEQVASRASRHAFDAQRSGHPDADRLFDRADRLQKAALSGEAKGKPAYRRTEARSAALTLREAVKKHKKAR